MKTHLFHTIVLCGAALGASVTGCADRGPDTRDAGTDAQVDPNDPLGRCKLPSGCSEHCAPLAGGMCIDPCFVHTETCSPDCMQIDGSCGWPPTK
jgi:hypothetical protein